MSGPAASLRQVSALFLKLGLLAFGGPAAHVALMRREVVERRRWLEADDFRRMFAACNLVPGPSSTELAIFIGYRLAGPRGLLAGGALFILPAMLMMLAIAWAYSSFGAARPAQAILYGVRPVIVGIVVWALVDLARRLLGRRLALTVSLAAAALMLFGLNPVALLLLGGLAWAALPGASGRGTAAAWAALLVGGLGLERLGRLPELVLTFLKIGAVSFGSGYVLLPFLRADFVQGLHWLDDRTLLDAVALGQATPGPVFTTATFLGYLFAGVPGALLATLAIFLPGFCLVPFLDRLLAAVTRHSWLERFVEGANAAAIGLIAATALLLARAAVVDPLTVLLVAGTVGLMAVRPLASPAAVFAGALAGVLKSYLG